MSACAFCGRDNDSGAKFCLDCGKPLNPAAARVIPAVSAAGKAGTGGSQPAPVAAVGPRSSSAPAALAKCPSCSKLIDPTIPFCPLCGERTGFVVNSSSACRLCSAPLRPGLDKFCARCGTRTDGPLESAPRSSQTQAFSPATTLKGPKLALLAEDGSTMQTFTLDRPETSVGRSDGDIRFGEDVFMSPLHAMLAWRDGKLFVRDLGSRNGTWIFIDTPHRLMDGDVVLVGSQLIRFRRLGYPGPHPPEADATRRLGSLIPNADVAVLAQLRGDGSVRDTLHLSPGRNVRLGREHGDWVFPYDQTMSGRHAEISSEDSDFYAQDIGSRNGVATAVRGERELLKGHRVLFGDQMLRVESV